MFILDHTFWGIENYGQTGRGVVAVKDIPPGTVIGDYLGKVIHPEEEDEASLGGLYGMCWKEDLTYLPDPQTIGVHLINHSCAPNCGIFPYHGHILFFAIRTIFAQEQLTVSYMIEPFFDDHDPKVPYYCHCAETICKGTMYANRKHASVFWDQFIRNKMGKYYSLPPIYGKHLEPLGKYPRYVPDYSIYDLFGASRKSPHEVRASRILSRAEIRSLIRSTGRQLLFPKIGLTVLGTTYPNTVLVDIQSSGSGNITSWDRTKIRPNFQRTTS